MKGKYIFVLVGCLFATSLWSINEVDKKGRKQGEWIKKYDNGVVMYKGEFKDDMPIGEFRRFYETGTLHSVQNHKDNNVSDIVIYEQDGKTISTKGSYIGKVKDGRWTYYIEGKISLEEQFENGKLNGLSKVYTKKGELIEEIPYVQGKIDGVKRCFLPDGKKYSECAYKEGVEHGDYKLYEGFDYPVIEGVYVHGKRNGEWQVRDDRGKLVEVLKYDNGVLLNDKELKKEYSKSFDENEAKKGKFIEPDRMLDAQ
jgi:antitoxin component YwqK of YwqJK toxin-antitoxin module